MARKNKVPETVKGGEARKVPFDPAKDRLRVPKGREKEFEAYMDKLATLFNPVVWDDKNNRPVLKEDGKTLLGKDPSRPASNLVPPNWRDRQGKGEFDRDYDYVAAFLAGAEPGINPGDNAWHMGDVGKMPTHETFSNESYYARDPRWAPYAGRWDGETYIPPEPQDVRQDAKGGDASGASAETPPSGPDPAQPQGGPRIVINPTTFKNQKDALCVAFNEGFRLWMEANDFQPQSEPTDEQRKFFSDTAYADDELQLRRTILARIATFDTSVKDPTDDQISETAQFLGAILESDWCKNEWERDCVSRLANAANAAVGAEPARPKREPLRAREVEPLRAASPL